MICPICKDRIHCQNCGDVEIKSWLHEYGSAMAEIERLKELLHVKHGEMPEKYGALQEKYEDLIKRIGVAKLAVEKLFEGL